MASGRGGDLGHYLNAGVRRLLMLEIDIDAIDEVINRKYRMPKDSSIDMNILQVDLNKDWKKNVEYITDQTSINNFIEHDTDIKRPVVFCHFALHYFLESKKSAENIAAFVNHYMHKDSLFIITIFDGQRVFNLLKDGPWNPSKKYMIRWIGKRAPKVFAGFENKIEVLLPFSDKSYEESLIDLTSLDPIFNKYGIRRIEDRNFDEMLDEYIDNNPKFSLDEYDKKFIGLYKYVIYKKF
jgi:hypothetical protein